MSGGGANETARDGDGAELRHGDPPVLHGKTVPTDGGWRMAMTAPEDFTESFFFPYHCVITRAGTETGRRGTF
jgi:hypothetical protein